MRYVSKEGFNAYMGDSVDDLYRKYGDENILMRMEQCEARMLAYIIPNTPHFKDQVDSFCRAVYAQLQYETSEKNAQLEDMPDGMTGFTVNGYSATFASAVGDAVSSTGLCRAARAELLLSGLLYRGVDCTC